MILRVIILSFSIVIFHIILGATDSNHEKMIVEQKFELVEKRIEELENEYKTMQGIKLTKK